MPTPIDSRQLLNFVTLAQTGSFTGAARELHLTQSAISHSIKALESDIGRKLIHRNGRKLLLTEHGEIVREEAQDILRRMQEVRSRVSELGEWGRGQLRISATASACQFLFPEVLREFKQCFPKCAVRLGMGDTGESLQRLRDNNFDLAVVIEPLEEAKDLTFTEFMVDELKLIMPATHPWAHLRTIPVSDFADEVFLVYSTASVSHRILLSALRRAGLRMGNFIEVGSLEAIKELVKIGQGLAFMAPWVMQTDLDQGLLVERKVPGLKIERKWCFAYQRNRDLSLFEETFIGLSAEARENLLGKNIVVLQ